MNSDRFKRQFPDSFGPLAQKVKESGTRKGIWGGPDAFDRMMTECRKYSPDLILLNHRLDQGEKGTAHSTTLKSYYL